MRKGVPKSRGLEERIAGLGGLVMAQSGEESRG